MKKSVVLLTLAALSTGLMQVPLAAAADSGALVSLRGATPIDQANEPDMFKQEKDRPPIPRDFVQQPPLIPHTIKNYQITLNFNKCMDCHSWSRYKATGAVKVSLTHFKDRDGREMSNISPRRYFCTQCHVPQTDAPPLVENTFQRAEGLR